MEERNTVAQLNCYYIMFISALLKETKLKNKQKLSPIFQTVLSDIEKWTIKVLSVSGVIKLEKN